MAFKLDHSNLVSDENLNRFRRSNQIGMKNLNVADELSIGDIKVKDNHVTINNTKDPVIYFDDQVNILQSAYSDDVDVIDTDKNTSFIDYRNLSKTYYTKIGGSDRDYVYKNNKCVDINNNLYVILMSKSNEVNIYDSTNNNVPVADLIKSNGNDRDIVIVKYNHLGVYQWSTHINGDDRLTDPSLVCDINGNIVLCFSSENSGEEEIKIYDTINNNDEPAFTITDTTADSTFILKYDSNGVFLWTVHVDGVYTDSNNIVLPKVSCDTNGNIFLAHFLESNQIKIYDRTPEDYIQLPTDFFIINHDNELQRYTQPIFTYDTGINNRYNFVTMKFDKNGIFKWINHVEMSNVTKNDPQCYIDNDIDGNIILTGNFSDILNVFNPLNNTINPNAKLIAEVRSATYDNLFLIKYNTDGNVIWCTQVATQNLYFEGNNDSSVSNPNTITDSDNNIYLTFTTYTLSYLYDTDDKTSFKYEVVMKTGTDNSLMIVKYNKDGLITWYTIVDGFDGKYKSCLAIDNRFITGNENSNIYLAGTFNNDLNFYNSTDVIHVAYTLPYDDLNQSSNTFISCFDQDGMFSWATKAASAVDVNANTSADDSNTSADDSFITADKDGYVYLMGRYERLLNIYDAQSNDKTVAILSKANDDNDVFIIKYNRYGLLNTSDPKLLYIEDNSDLPDSFCKQVILTNNDNNGIVNLQILNKENYGYSVRRNVLITESIELITKDGLWIPKIIADQYEHVNDLDVIDTSTKTSFVNYENLQNTFYTRIGGDGGDTLNPQIHLDKNDNLYMVGVFSSNELNIYDFTNTTVPVGSIIKDNDGSDRCLFLTKYDSKGVNQWYTKIGGDYQKSEPSVFVNANGDLFVTLQSYDDEGFIKIYDVTNKQQPVKTLVGFDLNSGNSSTVFVKYNNKGEYIWNIRIISKNLPLIEDDNSFTSTAVVTGDLEGNLFVSGFFGGDSIYVVDTGNDDLTEPVKILTKVDEDSSGAYFICKFDYTGKFLWINHIEGGLIAGNFGGGSSGSSADLFKFININLNADSYGNLYLTSSFYDNVLIYNPDNTTVEETISYSDETTISYNNETNNTFTLRENDGENDTSVTVTIPNGNYTRIELQSVLATAITNVSPNDLTYTVSSSTVNNSFYYLFTVNSSVIAVQFIFAELSPHTQLGFNVNTYTFTAGTGSSTLESINSINYNGLGIFTIKYNGSGIYQWYNAIITNTIVMLDSGFGAIQSGSCVDADGNLYISFTNAIINNYSVFDTRKISQPVHEYTYNENFLVSIVKFNHSGIYQWNNFVKINYPIGDRTFTLRENDGENDVSVSVTIPDGNYTSSELESALETALTNASPNDLTYTISLSNRYTFTVNSSVIVVQFIFTDLSPFTQLGFNVGTYTFTAGTDTSTLESVNDININSGILNPVITCDNQYITGQYNPNIYVHLNGSVDSFRSGFNFYNASSNNVIAYTLPSKENINEPNTTHSILSKFDANGNFQWATTTAENSNSGFGLGLGLGYGTFSSCVKTDSLGHVYITGTYMDDLSIWDVSTNGPNDDEIAQLNEIGGIDCYLIKYNKYGLINNNTHRNIYIEDVSNLPDAFEKSIVITNNTNNGPVNCQILEPLSSGFEYNIRKTITLTDSLDLVSNNGIWIPKVQAEQISMSSDFDVIDVNTKLSVLDYNDLNYGTWTTRITGSGNERNIRLSSDKDDNVYAICSYDSSTVTIGTLYNYDTNLNRYSGTGGRDIALVKYLQNGGIDWVTHIGFESSFTGYPSFYTDADGNSYISIVENNGASNDIYIFDKRNQNTPLTTTTLTSNGACLIKYDKNGIYLWDIHISAVNPGAINGTCVVADKKGNVYLSGFINTGIQILDVSYNVKATITANNGMFVVKFDKTGKYIWSIPFYNGIIIQDINTLSCDQDGNVIISATQNATVTVYSRLDGAVDGSDGLNDDSVREHSQITKVTNSSISLFTVKYDTNGKFVWSNRLGSNASVEQSGEIYEPVSVIDSYGNYYLAAPISGGNAYIYDTRNAVTHKYSIPIPTNDTSNTIFVKYNKNGIIVWYNYVSGFSRSPSICIDNKFTKGISGNNVYLTGSYSGDEGTLTLYNSGSEGDSPSIILPVGANLTAITNYYSYIAKFNNDGYLSWCTKVGGSNTLINNTIVATNDGHVYLGGEFNTGTLNVYQGWTLGMDPNVNIATTITNGGVGTFDIFLIKYNRYGTINNGGLRFGREVYLENDSSIPNGTEKSIVIINNNEYNGYRENVCLMILEKDYPGYDSFRNIWFSEGVSLISYDGRWFIKSSSGDTLPKRSIIMWGGNQTNIPGGWRLCDGGSLNGVTTPDLRGRFVLGYNDVALVTEEDTPYDVNGGSNARVGASLSVGTVNGEATHQLTIAEMPSHNHGVTDPGHNHTYSGITSQQAGSTIFDDSADEVNRPTETTSTSTTGISINNTGADQRHNNLPPYYVLAYIMKCF